MLILVLQKKGHSESGGGGGGRAGHYASSETPPHSLKFIAPHDSRLAECAQDSYISALTVPLFPVIPYNSKSKAICLWYQGLWIGRSQPSESKKSRGHK